jgi:hypothetical protein
MDLALGMRAGAIGFEPACAEPIEDRFGHDRARRIPGAKKKDIVGFFSHDDLPYAGAMLPGISKKRALPLSPRASHEEQFDV